MQRAQPFGRALSMMALVAAAMSLPNYAAQQCALNVIGPYESRGKGKGIGRNRRAPGAGMAAKRASVKRRNVMRHRKACR